MSATVTIEEAQVHLAELVSQLAPGEEVVIMDKEQPVARLVSVKSTPQRELGTMRGSVTYIAPDFDAPLEDFQESLP
jgi:antitoxin (DNA-binding transcriptional repressor) of toxin-antitoxin stability system